jgi:hypothetical protein
LDSLAGLLKMVSADVAAALSSPLSVIEEIYGQARSNELERQIIDYFRDLLKDRVDQVSFPLEPRRI